MALTSGTASLTSASSTQIVVAVTAASGGSGSYTYQWYRSSPGSSPLIVSGATSVTLTDTTVVAGIQYAYECVATDTSPAATVTSNVVFGLAWSPGPIAATAPEMTVGGVYSAAGVTLVDSQSSQLQLDSSGNLKTTSSGGGGGGAVTVADGADVTQGAKADAAYVSGSGSVVSILKGLFAKLSGTLATNSAQAARVTGTVANSSTSVTATVSAYSIATVTFSGTYAGITMNFEASDDSGVTYYSVLGSLSSSTASAVTSVALATNATVMYNITLPGVTNFRVRSSAYTSGTLNVGITATADPMVFNAAVGIVGNPILGAGSALIGKTGIDQTTPGTTNAVSLAQIGTTAVVTGGVNGSQGIGGHTANNATQAGNPLYMGATAVSAEPTLSTNGQNAGLLTDLAHKLIVMPYANKENFISGSATTTGTSDTSVIASAGAGLKNYVTGLSVWNSGATTATITLKNGSGGSTIWTTIAPAGGGSNPITISPPVPTSTATAVYFSAGSSSTTVGISVDAYIGS